MCVCAIGSRAGDSATGTPEHLGDLAIKILYVSPYYPPSIGGVELHVAELASAMAARGHSVEVLTQTRDAAVPESESIDAVRVRRFPVAFPEPIYAFAPGLWRHLQSHCHEFDLVHVHSYHALPSMMTGFTTCSPLVFTPHYHGRGHSPLGSVLHIAYRILQRPLLVRAAAIICVSRAEVALMQRDFPGTSSRIVQIPNGVDVVGIRSADPFPDAGIVVLTSGRILAYKGIDRVIRAIATLDERYRLVIVGDGPERPALHSLAHDLGVGDRVTFSGVVSRSELFQWLRTAAVYVSMSTSEAFGIAPLEAAVAGCRVIVSDIPAHREVLASVPGVTLLSPSASTIELAEAIGRGDQDTSRSDRSVEAVSWDQVAEQTIAVYERALMHTLP